MISWIGANIGSIVVVIILLAVVAGIITVMVKDKRKGKSSCGGNCAHCPMGGSCHKND